jgi:PST family polysaccharide transporter
MISRAAPDQAGLGREAARAVAWNYVSFASGKVLVLITMAVLARLLTPAEFGIVGFATLALGYLGVFKDLGLGSAIIQRRDDLAESTQTVFTLNLILGAILTTATVLAAPAVASFFDEPLVVPILRVLAMTFVLEALGSIHIILLKRNLDFRRKLVPDLGRAIVKGTVSITAATLGFGVWALVWGQLASVLAAAVLSWMVVDWRPRWEFHRRLVRPLLGFGVPMVVHDVQHAVWLSLDYVVVGKVLGDTALGVYTLAYRLPELLIHSIWQVVAGAIFPFLASIQKFPDLIRKSFLATVRYSQIIVVPLCLGLLITADPAVRVIFGEQWEAAIPVLRIMAVFTLITSIGFNVGDVYKAIGRPDILAKLGTLDLVVLVPALILAAPHGLVAVAWARTAVAVLDTGIRLLVARHFVAVSFRDIARELIPSFQAGAALSAAALAALWATASTGALASLVAASLAGAVAYAIALYRADRDAVARIARWAGLGRLVPDREEAA